MAKKRSTSRRQRATRRQRRLQSQATRQTAGAPRLSSASDLGRLAAQRQAGPLLLPEYLPGESFADFVTRQQKAVLARQQRLETRVAAVRRHETSVERSIREKGVGGLGGIRAELERQGVARKGVAGGQRMAIEATELYGEPALPAIYKKYDATIGGTNVGATLAGDMLNKLRSGAVAWEEKLFPGMKGAMPATLPEEAMRLLTAYPRRYLSKDIAHVEAAGAFGATFSGIHLPVQYGKGPASAMLNMPRGVIHAVERFTGETLPSFMGEGLAKEWQGALYGMRFPVYYPQRRVRTTAGVAAPSLISSFDVLAEELRAGGFGRRTTRDVAMGVFGRMGALETQPYTGVYRGYLGEMEIAKPGGGYASLVDVMQERKDEEYARLTKQFGGKIPRAGLIHGYESATAKAIVGATWEHQVFTDFGKVSGLLERGIVSTEALNYLLPFGPRQTQHARCIKLPGWVRSSTRLPKRLSLPPCGWPAAVSSSPT